MPVTITLPLQPQEEARLIAAAQAKGLSPDALVREAVEKILAAGREPQERAGTIATRPSGEIQADSIGGRD